MTSKPRMPAVGKEAAREAAVRGDGWGAASALLRDGEAMRRLKRAAERYEVVDSILAEDIVSDAFIALRRKVQGGQVLNPFGYAAGAVVGLARAEQRNRLQEREFDDEVHGAAPFEDPFEELPEADEILEAKELALIGKLEAFAARIEQSRPREVVEYVLEAVKGGRADGVGHAEVGEALGMSEGAAKIARLRGLARLRRIVMEEDEELAKHLRDEVEPRADDEGTGEEEDET